MQCGILDDKLYIFGGYDGSKCLTDFRFLRLPPVEKKLVDVNMAKILSNEPIHAQVEAALKYFARRTGESLDRTELAEMFLNLSKNREEKSSNPFSSTPQFDNSRVSAVVDLGFPRDHVIRVMNEMHRRGQDVKNFDLIVDRCLNEPQKEKL